MVRFLRSRSGLILELFEEIRYELNGVEIDHSRNVGITTSLKNYVSLDVNESNKFANAGWKVSAMIAVSEGSFNFCVPLSMLLGFAEDYTKIIPQAKHELILIRSKTNDYAVRMTTDATEYKLNITKIQWKIPHITLNDASRLKLFKTIQSTKPYTMSFRSWDLYENPNLPKATEHVWRVKTSNQLEKPRFILFGLQTHEQKKSNNNSSAFDHCKLKTLQVHLNSTPYPHEQLNISYDKNRYAVLYDMYAKFQESYYGYKSNPCVDLATFKASAAIVVVDCSNQSEVIKSGPVDVMITFETEPNGISTSTSAYCLLLHDRIIEYTPQTGDVRKVV